MEIVVLLIVFTILYNIIIIIVYNDIFLQYFNNVLPLSSDGKKHNAN